MDRSTATATVATETGFALLAALLVLIGLTAIGVGGFTLSAAEQRTSENHMATKLAYYAADAGLEQFLATTTDPTDTADYAFERGTARVWGTPMLDVDSGHSSYLITSVGEYSEPAKGEAVRTLHRVAILTDGGISVSAPFTAGTGLSKNGGSGEISGADSCATGGGDLLAGVIVPPGGYVQAGGDTVPDGEPRVDDSRSSVELLEATGIPWAGVLDGSVVSPDYTVPPDAWPDFDALPADEWPVIEVDASTWQLTSSHSGRGTIIMSGDLHMQGSFEWDGLVLVGGSLTSDGYQTLRGAIVTGLNALVGNPPSSSDIGNGTKRFLYDSCNVLRASREAFGGLVRVPGSWFEAM